MELNQINNNNKPPLTCFIFVVTLCCTSRSKQASRRAGAQLRRCWFRFFRRRFWRWAYVRARV